MHWVTVRPVCAVGDALGTGGGGPEGGLALVQRAMVALVLQVVAWALVLLVMPTVPVLGGCLCLWWSVRRALGGRGRVRVCVLVCTWRGLRGVCGRRVRCCRACGGLCCLVERGRCVRCVGVVGSGRRGWCRCGCLGLGAGFGRVVGVVQSGVMVVPLAASMVTVLQVVGVGRWCWRFPVWVV